jgi:hypothetical protein
VTLTDARDDRDRFQPATVMCSPRQPDDGTRRGVWPATMATSRCSRMAPAARLPSVELVSSADWPGRFSTIPNAYDIVSYYATACAWPNLRGRRLLTLYGS